MAFTVYDALVPPLTRGLTNFSAILKKAAAHAESNGMAPDELLTARLAPDMFPLTRQVQVVSDTAKNGVARLSGVTAPSWPDEETTFDQLQARIETTLAYLRQADAAAFQGAEDKIVTLPMPGAELKLPGGFFLSGFVLPNFYFHMTCAYAILRHKGVPLGKMDYLGGAPS